MGQPNQTAGFEKRWANYFVELGATWVKVRSHERVSFFLIAITSVVISLVALIR